LAVESADNMRQWNKYVYTSQCIIGTNASYVSESLSCESETANTLKSLVFLKLQGQKQMKVG